MIENTIIQDIFRYKKPLSTIPIWFMRQAGRYLPEYREIRKKAGSFNSLCYNSDYAEEVTLQPIRRFDIDAAIIFSDILVIPNALGQNLTVTENIGVSLEPSIKDAKAIQKLESQNVSDCDNFLQPVYEAIAKVRQSLDKDKSLFGFCGAPFTISSYMIAGKPDKELSETCQFYYQNKKLFFQLIEILCSYCIRHLCNQIKAGADIVQIFESMGGMIPAKLIKECSINPIQKICDGVKKEYPHIPIILFAKGTASYFKEYIDNCNIDALSIDTQTDIALAVKNIPSDIVLQGNLDPFLLCVGNSKMLEEEVNYILHNCRNRAFIFNLGHGIIKHTNPIHVEETIKYVRLWSKNNGYNN